MKKITVEIDTSCGTAGIPAELLPPNTPSTSTWSADELAAFSLLAVATSPPTYVGFTLSDTWAHKRYFAALNRSSTKLHLRPEWADIDSHQKTILADDFGVGFPLLYLVEKLGISSFAPTGWWIKAVERRIGRKFRIPKVKNGPPKLPDYICIDSANYLHALECKGTQTSMGKLRGQIASGITQVENLRASALPSSVKGHFRSWIVGGLFIPQHASKTDATLVIADPDFSALQEIFRDEESVELVKTDILLTNLCQQLSAIGLPRLATTLFNGRTSPAEREFLDVKARTNGEANFMGFDQEGDRNRASTTFRTFDTDSKRNVGAAYLYTLRYSIGSAMLEKLVGCISKTGVVDRKMLINVIEAATNMPKPVVPAPEGLMEQRKKTGQYLNSEWQHKSLDDTRTTTSSPFDIQFETYVQRVS